MSPSDAVKTPMAQSLAADLRDAVAALARHGKHDWECRFIPGRTPCTCGLAETLKRFRVEREPALTDDQLRGLVR